MTERTVTIPSGIRSSAQPAAHTPTVDLSDPLTAAKQIRAMMIELDDLRAINADLLAALEGLLQYSAVPMRGAARLEYWTAYEKAGAAIASAIKGPV